MDQQSEHRARSSSTPLWTDLVSMRRSVVCLIGAKNCLVIWYGSRWMPRRIEVTTAEAILNMQMAASGLR